MKSPAIITKVTGLFARVVPDADLRYLDKTKPRSLRPLMAPHPEVIAFLRRLRKNLRRVRDGE